MARTQWKEEAKTDRAVEENAPEVARILMLCDKLEEGSQREQGMKNAARENLTAERVEKQGPIGV